MHHKKEPINKYAYRERSATSDSISAKAQKDRKIRKSKRKAAKSARRNNR